MAVIAETQRVTPRESVLTFDSESAAEEFVADALKPFAKVTRQPRLDNGLRPDIGMRLLALPEIPLTVEIKQFGPEGIGSTMCDAIAQAHSYAQTIGYASFVSPLSGKGPTSLDWQRSSVGAMLLAAGEFSVGGLYFAGIAADRYRRVGGLVLGGVQVAFFSFNQWGDPETRLHSNAVHLLKYKNRAGSKSWR